MRSGLFALQRFALQRKARRESSATEPALSGFSCFPTKPLRIGARFSLSGLLHAAFTRNRSGGNRRATMLETVLQAGQMFANRT